MNKDMKLSTKNTYKLYMVFKRENHDRLVQKQFMHLNQGHPENRMPMLYFTRPRYLPLKVMRKDMKWTKKEQIQVVMVFKRENRDHLVQKQFMHLIQGHP